MPGIPYAFLGAFICTLFLLQWHGTESYELWILLIPAGTAVCGACSLALRRTRRNGWILLAAAAGMTVALGTARRAMYVPDNASVERHAGQTVVMEGVIAEQPDNRQTRMQYTVEATGLRAGTGELLTVHGRVLVIDRNMRRMLAPGDMVKARGKLRLPADDEDFSYKAYLSLSGIRAVLDAQAIERTGNAGGHIPARYLWMLRSAFEARIAAVFSEPGASLLAGLLTGSRQGLPADITEDFRRTGLSHIVAISGYNITIIIALIGQALFFLPLRWRFIPTVAAITVFTLFVGAGASVVRAAIMGVLGMIALQTGRMRHARLAVLWTAFFMLVRNPLQLWYDMGFQLSFLAVIGLVECSSLLERPMRIVPEAYGLRGGLQTTLAAQLTATPWIALRFGLVSLVSPLANIAVTPMIPFAMLIGFIGTVAGWIWEPLGIVTGFPAQVLLELIIGLAGFFASLPFSAAEIGGITPWMITGYYACLILMIRRHGMNMPDARVIDAPRISPPAASRASRTGAW